MHGLLPAVTIGLFALFTVFLVSRAYTQSPQYDDAFFACVSKNLAFGAGYRGATGDHRLFDPAVCAGPVLILPGALFTRLLGNRHWVPGMTCVVLNCLLLAIALRQLKTWTSSRTASWMTALLGLIVVICLSTESGPEHPELFMRCWFLFLGEILAALLAVVGINKAFDAWPRGKGLFLGGLFLGAAALTKIIAVFAAAGIGFAIIASSLRAAAGIGRCARRMVALVMGFLLPVVLFEAVKAVAVGGPRALARLTYDEIRYLIDTGSGMQELGAAQSKLAATLQTVGRNASILREHYFGSWVAAGAMAVILIGVLIAAGSAARKDDKAALAVQSLMLAAALHLAWWLAIYKLGMIRHLVPALVYFAVGAASASALRNGRRWALALLILLATVVSQRVGIFAGLVDINLTKDSRVAALLQTRDYLRAKQGEGATLLGCKWWRNVDLEYVLQGTHNFADCMSAELLPVDTRFLLVRSEYWNWEHDPQVDEVQRACEEHVVYRNGPFAVSDCGDTFR